MQLTTQQQQTIDTIAKKYAITFLVMYGSVVRGETHAKSDIDLAILASAEPDGQLYQDLYRDLAAIFVGQAIDIRFMNNADVLFMMQVLKNGVLIYGNQDKFDDLKASVNRRYVDDGRKYFPYRDQLLQENQKQLKKAVYAG